MLIILFRNNNFVIPSYIMLYSFFCKIFTFFNRCDSKLNFLSSLFFMYTFHFSIFIFISHEVSLIWSASQRSSSHGTSWNAINY